MSESASENTQTVIEDACRPPERAWSIEFKLQQQFPEDALRKIAESITSITLHQLGRGLDLSRLDGFTVAEDYGAALREVERGFVLSRETSYTRDEFATGVAMAVPVMRSEGHMTHVVFHLHALAGVLSETEEDNWLSEYVVAHELGHAHDLAVTRKNMPWFTPGYRVEDDLEGYLLSTAMACWEEYKACQLSAVFFPNEVNALERVFADRLNALDPRITQIRTDFVRTEDVGPAWQEGAVLAGNVLKFASYLLGHIDGAGQALADQAPEAAEAITTQQFSPHFDALSAALLSMGKTYGEWADLSAYQPLKDVALAFIRSLGFEPRPMPEGGLWITIHYPDHLTMFDVLRLKALGAAERARAHQGA